MKNKIIGIVITLIILVGMMASQVMAATLSASSTEVNKGEQVTVTVNLDNSTQAVGLELTYDASKFEYVKGSVSSSIGDITTNDTVAGKVSISAANATKSTNSVTFTFIAKENTEGATFQASGLVTESGETFSVDSVSVAVVEPAQEPTQPENPENPTQPENPGQTGDEQQEGTTNNEQNAEETNANGAIVDENGNVITKLPQTGVSVYQVIAGVAVVAVIALVVVRKIRK